MEIFFVKTSMGTMLLFSTSRLGIKCGKEKKKKQVNATLPDSSECDSFKKRHL